MCVFGRHIGRCLAELDPTVGQVRPDSTSCWAMPADVLRRKALWPKERLPTVSAIRRKIGRKSTNTCTRSVGNSVPSDAFARLLRTRERHKILQKHSRGGRRRRRGSAHRMLTIYSSPHRPLHRRSDKYSNNTSTHASPKYLCSQFHASARQSVLMSGQDRPICGRNQHSWPKSGRIWVISQTYA